MDSTTKIIELASQNNGIVTAAMISSAGISRGSLKYLADTGRLDQVSRGVYTLPEVWEDEFVSIQERYKRGVFALDTALFLHDLTDRTPHKFHMAFPMDIIHPVQKQRGFYALARKSLITVLESRWLTPLPEIQSGPTMQKKPYVKF